jgi:hypothetical protein
MRRGYSKDSIFPHNFGREVVGGGASESDLLCVGMIIRKLAKALRGNIQSAVEFAG